MGGTAVTHLTAGGEDFEITSSFIYQLYYKNQPEESHEQSYTNPLSTL